MCVGIVFIPFATMYVGIRPLAALRTGETRMNGWQIIGKQQRVPSGSRRYRGTVLTGPLPEKNYTRVGESFGAGTMRFLVSKEY